MFYSKPKFVTKVFKIRLHTSSTEGSFADSTVNGMGI